MRCLFVELPDGRIACRICGRPARQLNTVAAHLPSRGAGDTVAKITQAVGVKPCAGCKERQAAWNQAVPYLVASHDQAAPDPLAEIRNGS